MPSVFDVRDGDPVETRYAVPETPYVVEIGFDGLPIVMWDGTLQRELTRTVRALVQDCQQDAASAHRLGRVVQEAWMFSRVASVELISRMTRWEALRGEPMI